MRKKYTNIEQINISYSAPYNIDGYITVKTFDYQYSILIEAKYKRDYNNQTIAYTVLSQAINYIKTLNDKNELIPAVILLIEQNSTVVVNLEKIIKYLDGDYDWSFAASDTYNNQQLIDDLLKDLIDYRVFDYDNEGFDYNEMFEFIEGECLKSKYKKTMQLDYENNYKNNNTFKELNYITLAKTFITENNLSFNETKKKFYINEDRITIWELDNKIYSFLEKHQINDLSVYEPFKKIISNFSYKNNYDKDNREKELMLAWYNETFEKDPNTYILLMDLFDNYNNWLVNRGNSKVSLRNFTDTFKEHRIF